MLLVHWCFLAQPGEEKVEDEEMLRIANEIADRHGLTAAFEGDLKAVGVGGDNRTYERVVVLRGVFPGNEEIDEISREISNRTPISRVTYELARKDS